MTGIKFDYFILLLFLCISEFGIAQPADPFKKIKLVQEQYQVLPVGEVRPLGWLGEQILENLKGFTGHLDSLAPDLILTDDVYGKNRLSRKVNKKDVGALGVAEDAQVQFLWWNSETQSNWWDGYIRSAILTNESVHLDKVSQYVNRILATQDADGYLGIYDKELRYRFDNENGELWSKASLLRGLLAWYEFKNDKKVLLAVEYAVQNVMENYPVNRSHPFKSVNPNVGGTTHGLAITDVLENLYRLTGKELYRDYCLFLYKDFSLQSLNEDAQYSKLMIDDYLLNGHSVHTYEHLRSVAAAYQASGNPNLKEAIDSFIRKIDLVTTASGAAVGDEWIAGRRADATARGYEYCSLHELMHSYIELFLKSGKRFFAERAEKIFFNPAQGARHPSGTCITYLKTDNSYRLTGGLNGDTTDQHQTRYRYSPLHREAAVCCVPNAGRVAPYFIQHMWMKQGNTIANVLLGPSVVNTSINGKKVSIESATRYPFNNSIAFTVTATNNNFKLKIRKPEGITKYKVSEPSFEEEGFIVINRNWNGITSVLVDFFPGVIKQVDVNHEIYFTYGSLVLALPIKHVEQKTKAYAVKNFFDINYQPQNLVIYQYVGEPVQVEPGLKFRTVLLNPLTNKKETVELLPLGNTILRQVTFKNSTEAP